jgi:hypothetical protein
MLAGQGATTAAGDAANTVNTATGNANDLLSTLYNSRIGDSQPYQAAGSTAANALQTAIAPGGDLTKNFTAADMAAYDPGYAFRQQQGDLALQGGQAATGAALGGGALKQALRYNQDYASSEYQNAFQRFQQQQQQKFNVLSGTAQIGERANDQALATTNSLAVPIANNTINAGVYQGNVGTNAAQYAGNALMTGSQIAGNAVMGGANAQAAGQVASANALSAGVTGATNAGLSAYALYKMGRK